MESSKIRSLNRQQCLELSNLIANKVNLCENTRSKLFQSINAFHANVFILMTPDQFLNLMIQHVHNSLMASAMLDALIKNNWPQEK